MGLTFRRLAPFMDRVPYRHARAMRALLGEGRWLVDLGGGTGRVARRVRGGFARALVLDAERNMLVRARSRGLDAVLADARFLPVKAGALDAVLVVDAFHHFEEHARVLREAARALGPAGRLVVEEFDPSSLGGRLVRAFEDLVGFGSTFFAPDALLDLARGAGFDARAERLSRRDYALVATRR